MDKLKGWESSSLPGGISPEGWLQKFRTSSSFTAEDEERIKNEFIVDSENDLFIKDNGAVFEGYVIRDPSAPGIQKAFKDRIWHMKYNDASLREYDFALVPGRFPSMVNQEDGSIVWSTHVAVVTNYKDYLARIKRKKEAAYQYALRGIDGLFGSKKLPGAVDPFGIIDYMYGRDGDTIIDYREISYCFDSSKFTEDKENEIYVNENGAVLNAYDFSKLSEPDQMRAIDDIINKYKADYPEYELSIMPGEFPIAYDYPSTQHDSTHVLYIKNYKNILEKDSQKTY